MPILYSALAFSVLIVAIVAVQLQGQRKLRRQRTELASQWGRPKSIDRDIGLIASYHRGLVEAGIAGAGVLDERTWKDLDLDAVFRFLDRSESNVGRQVLYHRLRSTARTSADLDALNQLVDVLRADKDLRIDVQLALRSLTGNSVYWVWSLALEPIEPLPRWAFVYPLFAATMLLWIVLAALFSPVLLILALTGVLVGGVLRAGFGRRLVPLMEPFRDTVRLLAAAERLGGIERLPAVTRHALTDRLPALARLRRSASWIARNQSAGAADLGSLFIEYVNMLFCIDANAAMLGVRELRRHQDDLRAVLAAVGELDVALSVASVRDGCAAVGWTRPVFADSSASATLDNLRHPLLDQAVANSLTLGPPSGLLVTGANMTGKSTFLRTVGVNVVLAQAIDTVFATAYRAPWFTVRSCITPADDLLAGKSYYQAEVETLVAMLTASSTAGDKLYLFDELFRGTNTLDRIGAASAVLRWLVRDAGGAPAGSGRALVIAATHDLELVSLLTPGYDVVHFADELTEAGLHFDYRLRSGPTTTRNAIALLGVLGAPPAVVSEALRRAEQLRAAASPTSR